MVLASDLEHSSATGNYEFSSAIEAAYLHDTEADRYHRLCRWATTGTLIEIGCIASDVFMDTGFQVWAVTIRLALAFLFFASGLILNRMPTGWTEDFAAICPTALMMIFAVVFGLAVPEPSADRYFMAGGFGLICIAGLIPFKRQHIVAVLSLTIIGIEIVLFLALGSHAPADIGVISLFEGGTCLLAWVAYRRAERTRRRVWLFQKRDMLQVEELAQANKRLNELVHSDALTSVRNRRDFDEFLARLWREAQDKDQSFAVIMLDLDHFKRLNDKLGHAVGDRCLIATAQETTDCIRVGHDHVVRYGGEEFVVLLPNTSLRDAAVIAESIRTKIAAIILDEDYKVSASLGVAATRPNSDLNGPRVLMRQADEMLYQSKASGRNCVSVMGTCVEIATQSASVSA